MRRLVLFLIHPTPKNEIVAAHLMNVPIFLFAFAAFEYLLYSLLLSRRSDRASEGVFLPRRALLVVGYSLFLWVSIVEITGVSLRPDMLMSGFLYLAAGVLTRIKTDGATWNRFIILGVILGVGYLAKEPMLPIGVLMLAISLLLADSWRRVLPKALTAALLLLSIGSVYYIPLSEERGYFTFGESGSFNYLVHVDRAGPLYLTDTGTGGGKLVRSPVRIFDSPPTYEFGSGQMVTYALRFDPAHWAVGAKPRFHLYAQFRTLVENVRVYDGIFIASGGMIAGLALLCCLGESRREVLTGIARHWPLWVIGLAGLATYLMIHVEERYSGAFLLLIWLGLFSGMQVGKEISNRVGTALALGIAISLLLPTVMAVSGAMLNAPGDPDGEAGIALSRMGIHPGDPVARISSNIADLGWARVARVSIVSEVAIGRAGDFWSAGQSTQLGVLQALAKTGAREVVAHITGSLAPPGWRRLGSTPYWAMGLSDVPHSFSDPGGE